MKTLCLVLAICCGVMLFMLAGCGYLMVRCGVVKRILGKLGCTKPVTNWTLFSWQSSLEKMHTSADGVFFGDSIIRGGDFQAAFPQGKWINLGISGDTLKGMLDRTDMVRVLSPKKVFLMGGINTLRDNNVMSTFDTYKKLLLQLQEAAPQGEIYVHSLLPLSPEKERSIVKNETILRFNALLQENAKTLGYTYVDLFSLYVKDGVLNPAYAKDGLHIVESAYSVWMEALKPYLGAENAVL